MTITRRVAAITSTVVAVAALFLVVEADPTAAVGCLPRPTSTVVSLPAKPCPTTTTTTTVRSSTTSTTTRAPGCVADSAGVWRDEHGRFCARPSTTTTTETPADPVDPVTPPVAVRATPRFTG